MCTALTRQLGDLVNPSSAWGGFKSLVLPLWKMPWRINCSVWSFFTFCEGSYTLYPSPLKIFPLIFFFCIVVESPPQTSWQISCLSQLPHKFLHSFFLLYSLCHSQLLEVEPEDSQLCPGASCLFPLQHKMILKVISPWCCGLHSPPGIKIRHKQWSPSATHLKVIGLFILWMREKMLTLLAVDVREKLPFHKEIWSSTA